MLIQPLICLQERLNLVLWVLPYTLTSPASVIPMAPLNIRFQCLLRCYNSSVYALDPNSGAMGYKDDPHTSYHPEQYGMTPSSPADRNRFLEEKNTAYANPREKAKRKMRFWIIIACLSILLLVAALLVYFLVIKPKSQTSGKQ
jgi:hypothetical protein